MVEKQDLLRTTLVFQIGKQLEPYISEVDPEYPENFNLISLVSLGRITVVNDHFQLMQKKMSPEQIQDFVNRADETGKTALFYACHYNYHNLILYLLLKGANPFLADDKGRSPFHILCFKGLVEGLSIIWNFLRHNIRKHAMNLLKQEKKRYGFLRSDIKKGELVSPDANMESVKRSFIEFMPSITRLYQTEYLERLHEIHQRALAQLDDLNRTPIHYAAMNKYTKCYRASEFLLHNSYHKMDGYEAFNHLFEELQLLELNADKREETKSCLGFLDMVEGYLHPDESNRMNKQFHEETKKLQKTIVNQQDKEGYTPMHLASFYGDFLSVQLFLRLGGNSHIVDNRDNKKVIDHAANGFVRNALLDLQAAALKGDVSSFDSLLNCGNNIDERKSIYTVSPLHNAIQFTKEMQSDEMLKFVLKCGANIDIADGSGWAPLHHACKHGDLTATKILLDNHAEVNAISSKHFFPIHIAALNNHDKVINLLLQYGAKIECQNDENCTPLLLAAKKGHCEAMKMLLDNGANIYAVDQRDWTALHYAAYNGHARAVNLLCKYDADDEKLREMVNSSGKIAREISQKEDVKFQFNTLWKAAFDGHLDVIRRLHRFGEDINGQTRRKKLTPLIIAVQRHHLLVVKYLLDNGASLEIRDAQNKRALDYATEALSVIKKDRNGKKTIDPVKATKNEYKKNKEGKKEFFPDLVLRIEKVYDLFR